jgi:ACR3 family arsenite efflux pump ArsB
MPEEIEMSVRQPPNPPGLSSNIAVIKSASIDTASQASEPTRSLKQWLTLSLRALLWVIILLYAFQFGLSLTELAETRDDLVTKTIYFALMLLLAMALEKATGAG